MRMKWFVIGCIVAWDYRRSPRIEPCSGSVEQTNCPCRFLDGALGGTYEFTTVLD